MKERLFLPGVVGVLLLGAGGGAWVGGLGWLITLWLAGLAALVLILDNRSPDA